LFGGESAGRAAAGGVAQRLPDRLLQGGGTFGAFPQDEALEGAGPAPPPVADLMPLQSYLTGDVFVALAVKGQQDDLRPLPEMGRFRPGARYGAEDLLLTFGNRDFSGLPWHG
jgi:hypothetical protein